MDSSAVLFAVTIVIGFIFLRWLISPIPETNDFNIDTSALSKEQDGEGTSSSSTSEGTSAKSRNRRQVTDSMIEVVQTIAPRLTVEQIRFDLEKTGSVEVTVDNYMQNGDLPHPPK
ncbi:Cue1 protein [Candida orthopsilosis Co 90-125]|uniref:Cue1 protein n=1 Tax=Candida orthopsilosis (strain 90-125) TaxID=1136231 RepID=H8X0N9_CANO9|nr:Cue1 protein [Candida orthopsilosis Co 90-125]CCG21928.1 Cue1 protein [Candida orthopsilosis Co 90-125]